MTDPAGEAAQGLQAAAESGDFAAVKAFAARFGALVQQGAQGLPPDQLAHHFRQANRQLESARCRVCVERARIGAQLRSLKGVTKYLSADSDPPSTWSVRA
jgi:hypothetical protein